MQRRPDLKSPEPVPVTVNDEDRDAARRALARNWPDLRPDSPKYAPFVEALADFHHVFGADSFELRYNLRLPKGRVEELEKQFFQQQITEAEFRARMKAEAERPIDVEMLTQFHDVYQANLKHYSGVLQKAVLKPSQAGTSAWRANERAINEHVAVLRGKYALWRQHMETVFEFLEERRVLSGAGLVKVGDFEGTSAHWLVQLVFTRLTQAWLSCKQISKRSRRDPRYLYAARAIDLFAGSWRSTFPSPQSLSERLREEFVLARAAINGRTLALPIEQTNTTNALSTALVEQSIDNESREQVLIGAMFSLVGGAGHIFRPIANTDWGIDGEIEFKDLLGRASGRRLYVQLKSGDSYLVKRVRDGAEVFTVKTVRHLEYWTQQAYPVMLVIRQSNGLIRWMDVSAYLKQNAQGSRQIVFQGEELTVASIRERAEKPQRTDAESTP